jgi:hypothetical protein
VNRSIGGLDTCLFGSVSYFRTVSLPVHMVAPPPRTEAADSLQPPRSLFWACVHELSNVTSTPKEESL